MSAVEIVALAASFSLLSGWRLYFSLLVAGIAMRFDIIALPDQLAALDVLANPWVLGIAGFGFVAEFFADKIAWLDSLWDAVHTFIRPIGGALLALAIVDPGDPAWQVAAFLLGGGASLMTHGAKAGTRAMVNTSPEPFSNVVVSTGEDVATGGLLLLALANPIAAVVIAVLVLAATILSLVLIRRALGRVFGAKHVGLKTSSPPAP